MILYKTSTYSHHEEIKHMIKDSGVDLEGRRIRKY